MHTAVGLKPIEQIAVGDRVWSYDHRQLRWAEREVVEVYQLLHRGAMATLRVKGEVVRATGGHPFWVVRGEGLAGRPLPKRIAAYEAGGRQEGRWVLARDLRVGDEVLLRQGEIVALESVRLKEVEETVYNFHVAELQNYAVGECGVLVHNTNDPTKASIEFLRQQVWRQRNTIDREIARIALMEAIPVDPAAAAAELGYRPTNYRSHGQPVFTNGRTYITPDVDFHSGGVWKMADSVRNLGSKTTRMGTYDASLNRIGD